MILAAIVKHANFSAERLQSSIEAGFCALKRRLLLSSA